MVRLVGDASMPVRFFEGFFETVFADGASVEAERRKYVFGGGASA